MPVSLSSELLKHISQFLIHFFN